MDITQHISQLLKALVYIEDHLDEELSLDAIARQAHMSPYHFHRIFSASMGETLSSYIRRLRLQKAAGKLQYTSDPIVNIALDVGYESHAGFSKVFKAVMGQSPMSYRQKMHPVVAAMMERMAKLDTTPEIVYIEDIEVFFVREIGHYNEVPKRAFKKLFCVAPVGPYYSMALDDPNIVDPSNCRFDACAASKGVKSSLLGKKVIPGGRYACFTYSGPYENLGAVFQGIYASWYPYTKEKLADKQDFCEYIGTITKIYIPLLEPK